MHDFCNSFLFEWTIIVLFLEVKWSWWTLEEALEFSVQGNQRALNHCLEHCAVIQIQFIQKHVFNWNLLTIYLLLLDNVLNSDHVESHVPGWLN